MYKNSLKAKLCIKKMRDDTMEDIDRMYVCVCVRYFSSSSHDDNHRKSI